MTGLWFGWCAFVFLCSLGIGDPNTTFFEGACWGITFVVLGYQQHTIRKARKEHAAFVESLAHLAESLRTAMERPGKFHDVGIARGEKIVRDEKAN